MRRGHPGIGGWRNENPRIFRPRNGGNPHYRPPHSFHLLETPRYPPLGPRSHRYPSHFIPRGDSGDPSKDRKDRRNYRVDNREPYPHSNQERNLHHDDKHSYHHKSRHNDNHSKPYKDSHHYYESDKQTEHCHMNSLGDIDHRQHTPQKRDNYRQHAIQPWEHHNEIPAHYEERNFNNVHRQDIDFSKPPPSAYTGHRPPSSDYYGGNPTPVIDSSNAFSRSVDDTVDLVRRRLLNRNYPHASENVENQNITENQQVPEEPAKNIQHEPPVKKKQKLKSDKKSNCDKIKNKIVHQLLKMDKKKMHKLMDNPNSSTKFEYAISSLITESQNSYNRHLRSVAEKSLHSSSTDFINNDTVYEDTFMKQMQCILDPQDTIFLEDIKPIVMEELSKVLQLDDHDQTNEMVYDESLYYQPEQHNSNQYPHGSYDYDQYHPPPDYGTMAHTENEIPSIYNDLHLEPVSPTPFFERRSRTKSCNFTEESTSIIKDQRSTRRSLDIERTNMIPQENPTPQDLFNPSTEPEYGEDDPFDELDKQYHVAVDPDFIENEDLTNCQRVENTQNSLPLCEYNIQPKNEIPAADSKTDKHHDVNIPMFKQESDNRNIYQNIKTNEESEKQTTVKRERTDNAVDDTFNERYINEVPDPMDTSKESEKSDDGYIAMKNMSSPNSRKRRGSVEQRPSHRKEKRKKENQSDAGKQILNKNIIINVNDCAAKSSDTCDNPKSVFNLFFSKENNDNNKSKVPKNIESDDKGYSDKYVKRKDNNKKDANRKKKTLMITSSHSIVSSKDNNDININSPTTPSKEGKNLLKPIDMFTEQPRKVNVKHQAHRNTAPTPETNKTVIEYKTKQTSFITRKISKRNAAVQASKKTLPKETQTSETMSYTTRYVQTERKKWSVRGTQTDLNVRKSTSKPVDALERMKEIDLEIQVLLQEKFKLYNSLEAKGSSSNTMETLGMTVLSVTPSEEEPKDDDSIDSLSEDCIVEDFTSIPVEELEQIALESIQTVVLDPPANIPARRQKSQERISSRSPICVTRKSNNKAKAPNISLIEQIITDDRPLEDLISLDVLEGKTKAKSKSARSRPKPKQRPKKKPVKKVIQVSPAKDLIYHMKECYVKIVREDLTKYLKTSTETTSEIQINIKPDFTELVPTISSIDEDDIIETTVDQNDIFDMLDVSEDIVIGDNCEIKSNDDKMVGDVQICEEIILDNSQSSAEDNLMNIGQGDNECKMYDYSSDENLRFDSVVVSGNADAVLAIECIENNFLAACLDGNVYYFNSDGQLISTLRGSNLAVTCLTIVKEKYGTTVYTGSLDSRIRYYDLDTGIEKGLECNVLSPIQTMDRAWDTVFVGTRTGFVLQFECKNNMLIPVSTVKFSEQSILALRAMKEGPRKVLLVAARSENVTIKDAQTGLLLRTLTGPKMTVYSLLYEDGKVYCGTSSHQIHVFDYTSGSHAGTHEGGKGAVCLRASGGLLFAGCYDGCVYVYREGEPRPFAQIRGPSLMLLSLAIIGSKIIAGYKDRSLYIWKIPLSVLQEMIL